jgi:hypothetical protein
VQGPYAPEVEPSPHSAGLDLQGPYEAKYLHGYATAGDGGIRFNTLEEAEEAARTSNDCRGITYEGMYGTDDKYTLRIGSQLLVRRTETGTRGGGNGSTN